MGKPVCHGLRNTPHCGHAAAMRHGSDGSEVMEVMEEAGLPDLPVESAPKNVLGP